MKKSKCGWFLVLFIFLFSFPCYGMDGSDNPFIIRPFKKLGRGIANTVSAPLEIPHHMFAKAEKERKWWEQFGEYFSDTFAGIGWSAWRLGAGVYDIATFLLPDYEKSLIQPEYLVIGGEKEIVFEKCTYN